VKSLNENAGRGNTKRTVKLAKSRSHKRRKMIRVLFKRERSGAVWVPEISQKYQVGGVLQRHPLGEGRAGEILMLSRQKEWKGEDLSAYERGGKLKK